MERSLCIRDKILLETPVEATDEAALILRDTMKEARRALLILAFGIKVFFNQIFPQEIEGDNGGPFAHHPKFTAK